MTEEKINLIPESNSTPLIPEGNSILDQQDTSSASPDPAIQSTLVTLENSKAKHARRYSTGNIALPYAREKVLSRYLSPPASSCHDHCKYGTENALETKKKSRTLKSATVSKIESLNVETALTFAKTKKKLVVSSTRNPGSKSQKPDVPVAVNSKALSTKNQNLLSKQLSLPLRCSTERVLMRPIISFSPSSAKKTFRTGKVNNLKGLSHLEDQRDFGHADSEQPDIEGVPEKTIHVIESNKEKIMEPTEAVNHSIGVPPLSSKPDDKNSKRAQSATHGSRLVPPSAKKILRHIAGKAHTTQTPPSSGSKSLRRRKGVPWSSKSLTALSAFKSTNSSTSPESYETESRAVNTRVELKNKARKDGVISTKDKGSPARKLNFRRRKVVELQPGISTPRRLKFRQRVPADHQIANSDTRKCNLKKTEVEDGELGIARGESEKVVLRHQDMQRKKVRILFNNMIEETASKLAETRKSKVKALVGAFETVISLQDSKPASEVHAC